MTNKERAGRDKLMEAMRLSEKTYCDKFPIVNGEILFSKDYLRDVERLIRKSKNPIRWHFDTVGKRVAAAAIAAIALSGSMMSVSAVRKPVVEFITNVYEKFVEIFFDEEDVAKAPSTIDTVYTLGIVPEGYTINKYIIDANSTYMSWINNNGEKLVFMQGILDGNNMIDNEDAQFELISIDGMKIAYVNKNGAKYYFWNTLDYKFTLLVSETISHDATLELIESVAKFNQ